MDMDLESLITSCENELYLGFTNVESSGLAWLNKVCGELTTVCRHLQKTLTSKTDKNHDVETALLCTSQIVSCIKYLEKALTIEMKDKIVLTPTRQFFLDRIMWCLSRIKTINDAPLTVVDTNFVHLMDLALDLIAPLTLFASESDTSNIAKFHAEVSIDSAKIRSVVDNLIGQVLAFVNVTLDDDKKPLTCMCQKVLRASIAFEESCSMSKDNPDEQNRRLRAATLENSFYQLDRWINDSLLKLVFAVFVELKMDPIQKLGDICKNGDGQDAIDTQVDNIDALFEKIVQIGNFALSFSWDYKTKSNLRSSLASLESLDSFLIPAILSHSKVHSSLLHNHWNEEIFALINSIQIIIDTQAFCACIIDIFSTSINNLTESFDKEIIRNLLLHCDVLNQHFEVNFNDLALGTESPRSLYFDDFLLMVKECRAALMLLKDEEKNRIIKRLKILLSVLKKFHGTLKADDEQPQKDKVLTFGDVTMPATKLSSNMNSAKTQSMEVLRSETIRTEQFFESMGITATPTKKVLYESRREKSFAQGREPKIVDSTFKVKPKTDTSMMASMTPTRRVQKRASLRRALFRTKRTKDCEAKELGDSHNDDTLGLHITDILDQITDLSNTLSNNHHKNRWCFEQDADLV